MTVEKLRAKLIGKCKKCAGKGVIIKDGAFVECECFTKFKRLVGYSEAGISPRYIDFQLTDCEPDFLATAGNKKVVAHIKAYATSLEKNVEDGVGLYICGGSGLAKSALAQWLAREAVDRGIPAFVARLSDLPTWAYRERQGEDVSGLKKLRAAELVVLEECDKNYVPGEFFNFLLDELIGKLYDSGVSLVLTANCPKKELDKRLPPNVVDRFQELIELPVVGRSFRAADKAAAKFKKNIRPEED